MALTTDKSLEPQKLEEAISPPPLRRGDALRRGQGGFPRGFARAGTEPRPYIDIMITLMLYTLAISSTINLPISFVPTRFIPSPMMSPVR